MYSLSDRGFSYPRIVLNLERLRFSDLMVKLELRVWFDNVAVDFNLVDFSSVT